MGAHPLLDSSYSNHLTVKPIITAAINEAKSVIISLTFTFLEYCSSVIQYSVQISELTYEHESPDRQMLPFSASCIQQVEMLSLYKIEIRFQMKSADFSTEGINLDAFELFEDFHPFV